MTNEIDVGELKRRRMEIRLAKVKRMHDQGMFNREIGRELGVTGTQVARYLKYLNLKRNFHPELNHTPPQARKGKTPYDPAMGTNESRAPTGLTIPVSICVYKQCHRRRWKDGFCIGHWKRHTNGEDMDKPIAPRGDVKAHCFVPGCGRWAKDFRENAACNTHHERRRQGQPNWERPIKHIRRDVAKFGACNVPRLMRPHLKREADRLGLSYRELEVKIIERFVKERLMDVDGGDER